MTANSLLPATAALPGAVFAGRVSRADPPMVTLDSYGTTHEWGPARLLSGRALARGDRVLVLIDDAGTVWAGGDETLATQPVNASDYQGPGVTDHVAIQAAAEAASMLGRALYIPRRPTEWVIDAPIDQITGPIRVFGDWTPIRQATWHQAHFDLGTQSDVEINGFVLRCTETRVNGATSVRGDDGDRFGAGVWAAGSRIRVRHVRVDGQDTGVHLTNWTTGSTHVGTPTGSVVEDLEVQNVDFGVIAVAQDGLRIQGVRGSYVRSTGSGDPAHLVYVTFYGSDRSRDLTGSNWRAVDSTADPAYQIKQLRGGALSNLLARGCGGLLNLLDCQDLTIDGIVGLDDQKADENGSVFTDDTQVNVRISNLILRKAVSGRAIRFVGTDCVIDGAQIEALRAAGSGAEDIQIGGTRTGIERLKHRNAGSAAGTGGYEGILVRSTAVDCFVRDPEIRSATTSPGTRNCINIAAGATGTSIEYENAMLVPAATGVRIVNGGTATRLIVKA